MEAGTAPTETLHPKVARYLARLDEALVDLPDDDAAELRSQIRDHLADAVGPATSDYEVGQILERLGSVDLLVGEARGHAARRRRLRMPRLRRRVWALLVIVVALLGSGLGLMVDMATQPGLRSAGSLGWISKVDGRHVKFIDTLAGDEMVAPIRPGHRQGVDFTIYNPSNWPETVVGAASDSFGPGAPATEPVSLGVAAASSARTGIDRHLYFSLPVVVPPGGVKSVHFSWVSHRCFLSPGSEEGFSSVDLRVKVGWFTHTQSVMLNTTVALRGTAKGYRGCSKNP